MSPNSFHEADTRTAHHTLKSAAPLQAVMASVLLAAEVMTEGIACCNPAADLSHICW